MQVVQHELMALPDLPRVEAPAARPTAELLRYAYAEFNARGEVPVELFHEDVVYEQPDLILDTETYHGHDGLREALADMHSSFESLQLVPTDLLYDCGGRIVVRVQALARGLGSGAEVEGRFFHVWWMRDGKIAHGKVFLRRSDAIDAAVGESRLLAAA